MVDAGPRPIKRIPRNSNLLRDLIGGREADPVDVLRQHVRIAPHLLDCLLPIGLEDSHRSAGAHTTTVLCLACFLDERPPLCFFRSGGVSSAAARASSDFKGASVIVFPFTG